MPALQISSSPVAHNLAALRQTLHTLCGRGCAVYRPDLDAECPWVTSWKGVPGASFQTCERVAGHFRTVRGATLDLLQP